MCQEKSQKRFRYFDLLIELPIVRTNSPLKFTPHSIYRDNSTLLADIRPGMARILQERSSRCQYTDPYPGVVS
jgi:hypothetical protein